MSNTKRNTRRPAAWYELEDHEAHPFLRYFAVEPSENPTIRPQKAADRVPGEDGLVIVGRWSGGTD